MMCVKKETSNPDLKKIQSWIINNIENLCDVNVPIVIHSLDGDGEYELLVSDIDIIDADTISCKLCNEIFAYLEDGKRPIQALIEHAKKHLGLK